MFDDKSPRLTEWLLFPACHFLAPLSSRETLNPRLSHAGLQLPILAMVVTTRRRIEDRLSVAHLLSLRHLLALLVLEALAHNQ
ncbi:hypothetical protein MY10362_000206 [Beauveria mimosiformis]